jgi:hypothetical protein
LIGRVADSKPGTIEGATRLDEVDESALALLVGIRGMGASRRAETQFAFERRPEHGASVPFVNLAGGHRYDKGRQQQYQYADDVEILPLPVREVDLHGVSTL